MAELAFERFGYALESARGTAESVPTRALPLTGIIEPNQDIWVPDLKTGTLAKNYETAVVAQGAAWSADGPCDVNTLPDLLQMALKGGVSATTPVGGTDARNWLFVPDLTSDTLKTATMWWGDPTVQRFQSAFCTVDELTLKNNASGKDGLTMSVKGMGLFPETTSDTIPDILSFPLFPAIQMQLWLDTSSAIATTAITGRVISAEATIPTGVSYKRLATGLSGNLGFSAIGRGKRSLKIKLVFEFADLAQYNLWINQSTVKARVQFNGPLIEGALRYFVRLDLYGIVNAFKYGDFENTNRTLELDFESKYNATFGNDFSVLVQNKVLA